MPPLTGVSHLGLTVRDLSISEEWYTRLFELEQVHRERGPRTESVLLQDPSSGLVISLRHHFYAGSARFDQTRTGLEHLSFGVADRSTLDEWEERLRALRIDHAPVVETESGWLLAFRDPDHIQLELFCPRRPVLRVASPAAADAEVEAAESPARLAQAPPEPPAPPAPSPAAGAPAVALIDGVA